MILGIQFKIRDESNINKLNVGLLSQSSVKCIQKRYERLNSLTFYCPEGSSILDLEQFSLGPAQNSACHVTNIDSAGIGAFEPYENCDLNEFGQL